jgi:UDP-N-acetylmuramyl pentapeptide synthase
MEKIIEALKNLGAEVTGKQIKRLKAGQAVTVEGLTGSNGKTFAAEWRIKQ